MLNKPVAAVTPSNYAIVLSHFTTTLTASAFPAIQARLAVAPASVVDGMYFDGTSFGFTPLTLLDAKALKQAQLDAFFNAHFDLASFIRDGTVTTVTATQVGTFLATITNNYRTIRANKDAAGTIAAAMAIDVTAGWPSNP